MSWENKKWFVVGDSLSDDTLGSTNGNPKYYAHISDLTGISVIKTVKGGTGYWEGKDSNIAFYQRIKNVGADNDVDIVTVFGSVNDWKFYAGVSKRDEANYRVPAIGIDMNGNEYTFAAYVRTYGDTLNIPVSFFEQNLVLTDTESNTSGLTYGMSMVAYINEVINLCHQKFPRAKIVLVDEIYFRGTAGVRFDTQLIAVRNLKKAIVNYRASHGDLWLSLVELEKSVYEGLDVPERLYVNTIPGEGLSFYQIENDTFRAYYAYDGNGHPNTLYHRIWLSPVFAHIISEATGSVITEPSLMMTEGEKRDLDGLWINKPSTTQIYTATFKANDRVVDTVEFEAGATVLHRVPAVPYEEGYTGVWEPYTLADADITINAVYTPVQPDAIAYDINGDEIYNAYDINGASIAKLYDINGESLV